VTVTAGDIFMFAVDYDANKAWLGKNGTWVNGGDPALGTSADETAFPAESHRIEIRSRNNSIVKLDFGQLGYTHTPPTGFLSFNSGNLDTPTIENPSDHYNTVLYTSDNIGALGTQVVSGVGFQPDMVWIKNRSSAATSHTLASVGLSDNGFLKVDTVDGEFVTSEFGYIDSFDSDGYTLKGGATNANFVNQGSDSYVSWNWNESATPGFDIVSYTGTGSAHTESHSLSDAPKFIIIKKFAGTVNNHWRCFHTGLGNTKSIKLSDSAAAQTNTTYWNDTSPTSSNFTVGTNVDINENNESYIGYLWAEVEGFSRFGGYTGNGDADGPFVWCGFRPAYVLVKSTDVSSGWEIWDSVRSPENVLDERLNADQSTAESTAFAPVDLLSNGFKLRDATNNWNGSSNSYIFAAFAESPFKTARAR